jgi:putative protein kinase ArgK-like GTPase of G3E family
LGIRRGNAFRNMPAHHGRRGSGDAGKRVGRVTAELDGQSNVTHPRGDSLWDNPVLLTTASKGDGVPELVAALDQHFEHLTNSGELDRRRRKRLSDRTREVVDRATRKWVWDETRAEQLIAERLDEVVEGRLSPYELAAEVLDGLKQGTRA